MHVRFSTLLGMPILEEGDRVPVGSIGGILLNPDKGVVEGFFLEHGLFGSQSLFLAARDVARITGTRVHIRSSESLGPVEESVRLAPLTQERRRVLGQKMVTDAGRALGRCTDVQFNTVTFVVEWLFPRRLLRARAPIPVTAIVKVTPESIIIRESLQPEIVDEEAAPMLPTLNPA